MGDLNLDFDIGTKIVSVGDNSSDNLGFTKDNTDKPSDIHINEPILPNLNVSDGVELLAKGSVSPVKPDGYNSDQESKKSEDFSFFKPEDKGGIVDGDLSKPIRIDPIDPVDDNIIMNTKVSIKIFS